MARPRKPSARLELSGAFDKDPQRRRPMEPKPTSKLGDYPPRLQVEVQPFWDELVAQAGDWLTGSDRWAVEVAARLMEKAVRRQSVVAILELAALGDMSAADIKEMIKAESISAAELSTLRSLMGSLGITPADRAKLSVPQEKPKNRFAELAEEAHGFASSKPN